MILMLFLFTLFVKSKSYSHIFCFSHITNLTLTFKNTVSNPYSISPLFTMQKTLMNNQLTISNSIFSKFSSPIIQGFVRPLMIKNSKFTNCNTPIHLAGTTKDIQLNRNKYVNNEVNLEHVDYILCFSISSNGGCLYLSMCKFTIKDCNFFQNTANNGGAIYSINGELTILKSIFLNNSANEKGGALFLRECRAKIQECQIALNKANKKCGALYSKKCFFDDFISNTFIGNFANKKYGGMFLNESDGIFSSCIFKDNSANESKSGSSLAIIGNTEKINVNRCLFYDKSPYPLLISTTSFSDIVNNIFAASERDAIYILNKSSEIKHLIVNILYNFQEMPKPPEAPLSLLYSKLNYIDKTPPFKWNLFFIVLTLSLIIFGLLIEWLLPFIIWPNLVEKKGYIRA